MLTLAQSTHPVRKLKGLAICVRGEARPRGIRVPCFKNNPKKKHSQGIFFLLQVPCCLREHSQDEEVKSTAAKTAHALHDRNTLPTW